MHKGATGQIRKTAMGRCLLFHINTGLFWFYGILTFMLAFSLSGFWIEEVSSKLLFSLPIAFLAAFTLARLVHILFWQRFRHGWMDNYVMGILFIAGLVSGYFHDIRDGRKDAPLRLATHVFAAIIVVLISYVWNRKKAV